MSRSVSVFAKTEVNEIFPTPLWVLDLEPNVHEPLNRELRGHIERLISPRPELGLGVPLQTDPVLHTLPEFANFIALTRQAVDGALRFLEIDHAGFEITGCWANINPTGAINSSHNHPNNFLSGVYYVATPPASGDIEFGDPRLQAMQIVPPVKRRNRFNGNSATLSVRPGLLALFPAWLMHSVGVNRSAGERVTISFNAMFTEFSGRMAAPLWRVGTAPIRRGGEIGSPALSAEGAAVKSQ